MPTPTETREIFRWRAASNSAGRWLLDFVAKHPTVKIVFPRIAEAGHVLRRANIDEIERLLKG